MKQIKNKIVVLSGKGGVGKSTVAANLALALADSGAKVGLLDADIHGPSIPTLFRQTDTVAKQCGDTTLPVAVNGIRLMSAGFLIADPDQAIIVRGPMKMKILEQMLQNVDWGELDYLIVDCPPGTGDEPLSICQLIDPPDGAVMVTTPQEVAAADVRKCIQFCRKLDLPILGILENMSAFVCPKCGETVPLFGKDGGRLLAEKYNLAVLGNIPIDPAIGTCADQGNEFLKTHGQSAAAQEFRKAVGLIQMALKYK
ncbi:MAG: Mrp/NBP35 family ATP-binding protein [Kiritimatiellales bacterium]